ncbi:hypothetical protein LXL04_012808 [Taraxacum kok-saghyz]
MRRVFGVKKDKEPPPSLNDASDRINKRGETVDEKIKRLDGELARYKEQIKKTRPGPAQEAVKARAMRVLKQKRMYEGQRDMLYNQTFNLDQVAFASEGIKDAQQTMSALKSANKELKGMMKTVKIQDIDNLQDEMMDMMDISNEIQESLGRSYSVPDDIDEDDLMGELDALEADMGQETEGEGVPSYLQPDNEPDLNEELNLPSAPSGHAMPAGRANNQAVDEFGFPAVPHASLRIWWSLDVLGLVFVDAILIWADWSPLSVHQCKTFNTVIQTVFRLYGSFIRPSGIPSTKEIVEGFHLNATIPTPTPPPVYLQRRRSSLKVAKEKKRSNREILLWTFVAQKTDEGAVQRSAAQRNRGVLCTLLTPKHVISDKIGYGYHKIPLIAFEQPD